MAKTIDPAVVEKYQLALQKDPNSQVFAPLAEAYREMKLLKEADKVIRDGMKRHPNFVSGLVTLAKILRDQGKLSEAIPPLKKAAQLSPENILAQQLMAEIYLASRQPKEALKAFKMVLFLNPSSKTAQNAVNKLESLTADEYDEEVFEMAKLHNVKMNAAPEVSSPSLNSAPSVKTVEARAMERMLSLIDAFIVRNDLEKAHLLLKDTRLEFGDHPEIQRRMKSLQIRTSGDAEQAAPLKPLNTQGLVPRTQASKEQKLKILNEMLSRIDGYRQSVEI